MATLRFPRSSTPGRRAGEGEGRLVNAYFEKAGDTTYIRRVPGLASFAATGGSGPRGLLEVNGGIYAAYSGAAVFVSSGGGVFGKGSLAGTAGVTWARNNRVTGGVSTPDVVAVRSDGGAFWDNGAIMAAYPDADLPTTVNSVDFLDGYFLFTIPDGRIFASDLNATAVNALSFATAESRPDGLVRGIVHGGIYYAMGAATIEPWKNTGASPFPLARVPSVLPVGLLTAMAVAGFEEGWEHPLFFVAHDRTVHALDGYRTTVVSTPDVEAFIASSTASTLEVCVFTSRGHAFVALSSNLGTWVYDVTTKAWHERLSTGAARWRASRSVKVNGAWVFGDTLSTSLLQLSEGVTTEAGAAVAWTVESAPLKEFPARSAIPAVTADFTAASANVAVSVSKDGGANWTTPRTRSLANAGVHPVRVNRLGLASHHGLRVRLSSSDAADFAFMGAATEPQERAP